MSTPLSGPLPSLNRTNYIPLTFPAPPDYPIDVMLRPPVSMDAQRDAVESIAPPPETEFLPPDMSLQAWEDYRHSLRPGQQKTLSKMDAVLAGFAYHGSIYRVAPSAHIHRNQVYEWIARNLYRFKDRLDLAGHSYRERLQDLALAKVEAHPKLHDILHIAMLNAAWPERYRRDTVVIGGDHSKEMLAELRKLTAMSVAARTTVEAVADTEEQRVTAMLGPGGAHNP